MSRTAPSLPRLRYLSLGILLALGACAPVSQLDRAMRRVDVLDRVFEPERFRTPPPRVAEPPPVAPPEAADAAALQQASAPGGLPLEPNLRKDEVPPPFVPAEPAPLATPLPEPAASRSAALPAEIPFGPSPSVPAPVEGAGPPTTEAALRRNPWLVRFWAELTPNQRRRVAGGLPRESAPEAWDRMGLPDRARLLYGS